MSVPPIKGSWWVEDGRLLAGPTPACPDVQMTTKDVAKLLASGARCFIDLRHPSDRFDGELPTTYDEAALELSRTLKIAVPLSFVQEPIVDGDVPSVMQVNDVLDTIDAALNNDRCVYVHCHGGHGRTGTVVGCWLVRHGMTGEEALNRIFELRLAASSFLAHFPCPQTPKQVDFVRNFIR